MNLPLADFFDLPHDKDAGLGMQAAQRAAWHDLLGERKDSVLKMLAKDKPSELNAWVHALRAHGPLLQSVLATIIGRVGAPCRDTVLRYALCRALHLSPLPAVSRSAGVSLVGVACALCGATASTTPASGQACRNLADPNALHAGACNGMYKVFNNSRRHDIFARINADLAASCGFDASFHDGPIFDHGRDSQWRSRLRPADWYIRDYDLHKSPEGICFDCTIISGPALQTTVKASEKIKKYTSAFERRPHLGFIPVVSTINGHIGVEAEQMLTKLSQRLTARRLQVGDHRGQPLVEVVAAYSYALALVMVAQLEAYAAACASKCVISVAPFLRGPISVAPFLRGPVSRPRSTRDINVHAIALPKRNIPTSDSADISSAHRCPERQVPMTNGQQIDRSLSIDCI